MTAAEILRIREVKSDLKPGFIRRIDKEWKEVIQLFQGCRYDLSKIRIVSEKDLVGSSIGK